MSPFRKVGAFGTVALTRRLSEGLHDKRHEDPRAEHERSEADDRAKIPPSGRGSAWWSTRFGTEGSEVRILSPRPLTRDHT